MHLNLNAAMKISVMAKSCTIFIVFLFFHTSLQAGPLRISFLNNEEALQSTLGFLKNNGCSNDAVGAFRKAVERYNSTGLKFDLTNFPTAQHGFYSFQSSTQLLAVIPRKLWDIPHTFDFNCFDTIILLGDGQLRTGLHPDEHRGEILAQQAGSDGHAYYTRAETAKEAFNLSYPAGYRIVSDDCIPSSMVDTRICLTAAFYCLHMLPASTTPEDEENQIKQVLRASWKNQSVEFPSGFQIVLCHGANLANHLFATVHAGVLFTSKEGYVYIEKDGGSGPFVRLDFGDKSDLIAWLAWKFDKSQGDHFFVTFNDSKIETVRIGP
jgi:hypothetical protein